MGRAEVPAWDRTPVGAQAHVAAAWNLQSASVATASASGSGPAGRVRQTRVGAGGGAARPRAAAFAGARRQPSLRRVTPCIRSLPRPRAAAIPSFP